MKKKRSTTKRKAGPARPMPDPIGLAMTMAAVMAAIARWPRKLRTVAVTALAGALAFAPYAITPANAAPAVTKPDHREYACKKRDLDWVHGLSRRDCRALGAQWRKS